MLQALRSLPSRPGALSSADPLSSSPSVRRRDLTSQERRDLRRLILLIVLFGAVLGRPVPSVGVEGRVRVSARVVEVRAAREATTMAETEWLRVHAAGDSSSTAAMVLYDEDLVGFRKHLYGERSLGHGLARFQWMIADSTRSPILQIEWTGN